MLAQRSVAAQAEPPPPRLPRLTGWVSGIGWLASVITTHRVHLTLS